MNSYILEGNDLPSQAGRSFSFPAGLSARCFGYAKFHHPSDGASPEWRPALIDRSEQVGTSKRSYKVSYVPWTLKITHTFSCSSIFPPKNMERNMWLFLAHGYVAFGGCNVVMPFGLMISYKIAPPRSYSKTLECWLQLFHAMNLPFKGRTENLTGGSPFLFLFFSLGFVFWGRSVRYLSLDGKFLSFFVDSRHGQFSTIEQIAGRRSSPSRSPTR